MKSTQRTKTFVVALSAVGLFLFGGLGLRRAAPTNGDAGSTAAHARELGKRGAEPLAIRPRYGWKGSTSTDDWDTCNDANGGYSPPSSTLLNAHFDVPTGTLMILPMNPAQVQDVYDAAFATCLMTDYSDSGPDGKPAKAWQHDVLRVPSGNQEVSLHFRPAGKLPKMLKDSLEANQGFVAGDFTNTSGDLTVVNGRLTIYPFHSVIFWIGKDDTGRMYSALLDLKSFPFTHTAGAIADIVPQKTSLMSWRRASIGKVAFARFKDPHAVGPRPLIPDETWVSCAPGCCFSNGFQSLFKGATLVPYLGVPSGVKARSTKKA